MSVDGKNVRSPMVRSAQDEAAAEALALENELLELQVRQLQLELEHYFQQFRRHLQQNPRRNGASAMARHASPESAALEKSPASEPDSPYRKEMGALADALKARGIPRVVIWGGGAVGRALVRAARAGGIEVIAVVDREGSLAGTGIDGVEIVAPDEVMWDGVYVIASYAFTDEIRVQSADLAEAFGLSVEILGPDGTLLWQHRASAPENDSAKRHAVRETARMLRSAFEPGRSREQLEQMTDALAKGCRHRPWSLALLLRKFHLETSAGMLEAARKTLAGIERAGIDSRSSVLLRNRLARGNRGGGDETRAAMAAPWQGGWHGLRRRIKEQQRLRIVFVNDNGFSFGAGVALRRQLLSFLNAGHEVASVCWKETLPDDEALHRYSLDSRWLGKTTLPNVSVHLGMPRVEMTRRIVAAVNSYAPNLVIAGNFHAAGWPPDVLTQLHRDGIPVIAYAHDCDWASGGCAYPAYYGCEKFLTGCTDGECPKPSGAFPPGTENRIERNWLQRTAVFGAGEDAIPLATNSAWNGELLKRRFGPSARVNILHCGLDTDLFHPGNKAALRAEMGLPEDAFVILVGSGFFGQAGKGARHLREIFDHYAGDDRVHFLSFGHPSAELRYPRLTQVGYVATEREMARLYQTSDLFLNPVEVEAFGQTMLEASACGCPVVAFGVCGVPDVARHELNALIAKRMDAAGLIDAIEQVRASEPLRTALAEGGRQWAERRFSLGEQYRRWELYLRTLCETRFSAQTLAGWQEKAACSRACEPYMAGPSAQAGGLRCRGREKASFADAPLITVATVIYNDVEAFGETLFSVLEQDYPNLEWIVIDGGSTDGTPAQLQRYDACIDLWVSEPDRGIYDAMNKAAALANGEWIIYMNAGDFFCGPAAISEAVCNAPADAEVVYGFVYHRLSNGSQTLHRTADFNAKWDALMAGALGSEPWLFGLPPHQATFTKTELVRKLKFDLGIKVAADWDLLFRAKAASAVFHRTEHAVAVFKDGGYSARHVVQWVNEVWMIARRHAPHAERVDSHFASVLALYEKNAARGSPDTK